jgi:hypothetical protein
MSPPRLAVGATAAATGALALAALLVAAPVQNQRLDSRAFASEVQRLVPPGGRLAMVEQGFEEIAFYSGRVPEVELRPGRRLDKWMGQDGPVYAVLDRRAYEALRGKSLHPWNLLARNVVAGVEYFLVGKE